MLISMAPLRQKVVDEKIQHLINIHVNFPQVCVDRKQALYVYQLALSTMKREWKLSSSDLVNPWEDRLDEGVYREKCGGLRVIGNCKAKDCKCKGAQHCQAQHIGNSKKINVGRPYSFYMVFNEDGSPNHELKKHILESKYLQVALTRIRQFGPSRPDFKIPENCPHPSSEQDLQAKRRRRARKGISRLAAASELESNRFLDNIESMRQFHGSKVFLTPEDGIYQDLEKYLHEGSFHSNYNRVNITSIFTNPKKTYFVVNVD
ncbi:unnamed protein product, partial [marine sediment metagenome]